MRVLAAFFLSLWMTLSWAVPAKKEWRVCRQADGSSIELMLVGDEHFHYYITRDSVPVMEEGGAFYYADAVGFGMKSTGVMAHDPGRRTIRERQRISTLGDIRQVRSLARRFGIKKKGEPDRPPYVGSKRGLIILANFSNKQFEGYRDGEGADSVRLVYDSLANMTGYTNHWGAIGSVHDYYHDQSNGLFDLSFDVMGPVNLDKAVSYYGRNRYETDIYAPEMVIECCQAVDSLVDFSVYDWDGDGFVEEVFVLYAGLGEASGGGSSTIWPHMWTMTEAREYNSNIPEEIVFDGVNIEVYACSNELYKQGMPMGLGTLCHEFSHCLGLPDFYDTGTSGNYGMSTWDILDQGSYNGPYGVGWVPAGYTSYERHFAGWLDYTELSTDTVVSGMRPVNDAVPEAYIIYNDSVPTEYYLLENRNKTRWDAFLPGNGLLIIHVDYDELLWESNQLNATSGYGVTNDHERFTVFHSSNTRFGGRDAYPYNAKDSLTDFSKPAAKLYNPNLDGSLLMHKPITGIQRDDSTGLVSFTFRNLAFRPEPQLPDTTSRVRHHIGASEGRQLSVYTPDGNCVRQVTGRDGLLGLRPGVYILRKEDGTTEKIRIDH